MTNAELVIILIGACGGIAVALTIVCFMRKGL